MTAWFRCSKFDVWSWQGTLYRDHVPKPIIYLQKRKSNSSTTNYLLQIKTLIKHDEPLTSSTIFLFHGTCTRLFSIEPKQDKLWMTNSRVKRKANKNCILNILKRGFLFTLAGDQTRTHFKWKPRNQSCKTSY